MASSVKMPATTSVTIHQSREALHAQEEIVESRCNRIVSAR